MGQAVSLTPKEFDILYFLAENRGEVFTKEQIYKAVWKNMTQEEKEKIKIVPLCRNIGEVIALNGLIFLLKGLWPGFENHWFVTAMIAWFIVAGFDLWYIEKSNRYHE